MAITNEYLKKVYEDTAAKNPNEPEFLQTVKEVFESLSIVADKRQDFIDAGIFERMVEPERVVSFRVSWVDDNGKVQVTAATAYSSTRQSVPTRAVFASILP